MVKCGNCRSELIYESDRWDCSVCGREVCDKCYSDHALTHLEKIYPGDGARLRSLYQGARLVISDAQRSEDGRAHPLEISHG